MNDTRQLQTLLAATAAGNREAFSSLYTATSAKLFGVILRILRERPLSEEALQDTYLRIWSHADSYSAKRSSPMTWMITIARNQALDRRRRAGARPAPEDLDEVDPPQPGPEPLDCSLHNAESRMLYECMGKLTPDQRRCIELAYRDGYTHSELAELMGCPVGTVKSWSRRGLARLRELMNDGR